MNVTVFFYIATLHCYGNV